MAEKYIRSTNLNDSFITSNCYTCIEINAHNLIQLIRKLRHDKTPELFVPTLFNSQMNEETFRQVRSMGTVNYTKVNFSLLELLHLIGRIELQNNIVLFKLANSGVEFPRNNVDRTTYQNNFDLPSDEEMKETLKQACTNAINDAYRFGMNVEEHEMVHCDINDLTSTYDTLDDTDRPTTPENHETDHLLSSASDIPSRTEIEKISPQIHL